MSRRAARGGGGYRISVVAERYGIHPQTLRMYEREGLLRPSRSAGNTRLYDESDLRNLEVILHLTRDLGINLAGVEVVLNMRRTIVELQRDMERLLALIRNQGGALSPQSSALVPVQRPQALQRLREETRRERSGHPIDSADS